MLVNEFLVKTLERFACALIENSLFYRATMKQNALYLLRQMQNQLLETSFLFNKHFTLQIYWALQPGTLESTC